MLASTLTLLSAVGFASAVLDKTQLWPQGLGTLFEYNSSLPAHSYTAVGVVVPQTCLDYAANGGSPYCAAADMIAQDITYDDCSQPWHVCQCTTGSVISIDDLVRQFGRLPVNLRDYVRYVIGFPASSDSAFSESSDMVVFGPDLATESSLSVFVHESGHDIDQGTSEGTAWTDAINADTCVPDYYAATNAQEDFAQMNVVALYIDLFGQAPGGTDTSCMANQLAIFSGDARLNKAGMALATCDLSVRSQHSEDFAIRGSTKTVSKASRTTPREVPKPTV